MRCAATICQAKLTFPASSTSTRSDSRIVFTRCLFGSKSVSSGDDDEGAQAPEGIWRHVRYGEHRNVRELWPADDLLDGAICVEVHCGSGWEMKRHEHAL